MSTPAIETWNDFWFRPESPRSLALIRGGMGLIAALSFMAAWPDASLWYGSDGLQSSSQVAAFLTTAGLAEDAKWHWSPLFFSESIAVYSMFLGAGVFLGIVVAMGIGGRAATLLLWAMVVAWANRALFLAGMVETLLSLGLFAASFAPAVPVWVAFTKSEPRPHWGARFARQLIAVEMTLLAIATTATMLAGDVWWNGLGAFAMAAPAEDRTIDWTTGALSLPVVHDVLSLLLVVALPVGVAAAWQRERPTLGRIVIAGWCLAIALLGSHWLYAAALATLSLAIAGKAERRPREPS